eukprot:539086_1
MSDVYEQYTQLDREKLSFGFITEHSNNLNIPSCVKHLCLKYFDEVIYWNITEDSLKEFLNAPNGKRITGPIKKMNEIKYQLFVFPNGELDHQNNFVFFGIQYFLPSSVQKIVVYSTLSLLQYDVVFSTLAINHNNKDINGFGWEPYELMLSTIRQNTPKMLSFSAYIQPIIIETNDVIQPRVITPYNKQNISMNYRTEYQWTIDEKMMTEMKNQSKYLERSWSSNSFGICGNFKCICSPNYYDDGDFLIAVELLRLPNKIQSIEATSNFELEHERGSHSLNWGTLNYAGNGESVAIPVGLHKNSIFSRKTVTINILIEIDSIITQNGLKIDLEEPEMYDDESDEDLNEERETFERNLKTCANYGIVGSVK